MAGRAIIDCDVQYGHDIPLENQSEQESHDSKKDESKLNHSNDNSSNFISSAIDEYDDFAHLSLKFLSPYKEIHCPPPE